MNKIKYVFKKIISFLDKIFIIPISKLFIWVSEKLKIRKIGFDKILSKNQSLVFISLILSLVIFFFVENKTTILLETSADIIYNQKVNAIFNEEAYVIEGLPETVDITLIGRKSDLYLAKQLSSYEVSVDLKNLKPGTHKVTLKYKGSIDTINYKIDPSVASIIIYSKVSEVRSVNVDILNKDKLNPKLSLSTVDIDTGDVIIKGAQYKLNEVSIIKAMVDINNIPNIDVGTVDLTDIPLIAYDQSGNVMNVEIVPSKVNAKIKIESPKKILPIKLIPIGEPAFGKAIKTLESSIESVTVYGDKSVLDTMNHLEINVNIDGISEDKKTTITIKKPTGIRYMSSNSAEITIALDEVRDKEIKDVVINIKNLPEMYIANAASEEDRIVDVIVKGVSSILENIDASSIEAFIDLKGYGEGKHEVPVLVEGNDIRLTYLPKIKKVNVIIMAK